MKKRIYLLILVVATMLFIQSCEVLRYFTIVIAAGKSSIVPGKSWDDPLGVQAGVSASVANISESVSFRPEVNVSIQGAKWKEDLNGSTLKGRVNLLYVTTPLVVRYQIKSGFFAEAGVQPGLLVSAKDKYSGETHDYKPYVNIFDLGVPVGVGKEFKNHLGVSLRAIPGLTNINKEDDSKDRNLLMLIRATYTIPLALE